MAFLAGGLGLWSWMSKWERQSMLSSLQLNPVLAQFSESELQQLVQLGGRLEILPGTSTLPTWKLRGILALLMVSTLLNLRMIVG